MEQVDLLITNTYYGFINHFRLRTRDQKFISIRPQRSQFVLRFMQVWPEINSLES